MAAAVGVQKPNKRTESRRHGVKLDIITLSVFLQFEPVNQGQVLALTVS